MSNFDRSNECGDSNVGSIFIIFNLLLVFPNHIEKKMADTFENFVCIMLMTSIANFGR